MMDNGISNDFDLINRLFWVFTNEIDDNLLNNEADQKLDLKELVFGFVLFNDDITDYNNEFEKKLKRKNLYYVTI